VFGLKGRRRRRLRARPLEPSQESIIARNVPWCRGLDDADRRELGGLVQVLLAEKRFEGCGGMEIDDTVRLTIVAQAAVLLLHRDTDFYPKLDTILVYPHSFVAPVTESIGGGAVLEGEDTRVGESWSHGSLVLSWKDVVEGAADPGDGWNVVFHEFAHQLDEEATEAEGMPVLTSRAERTRWAEVLSKEYDALIHAVERGRHTFIDPYATESPAEFFAVVTEHFLEQGHALKREHPELYRCFADYYRQDTAVRGTTGAGRRRRRVRHV
jgi:Mlc titration factor MtfA (ptsG expression regulator)